MNQSKACNTCKQIKPLDAYPISKASKGGHSHKCKVCRLEQSRARKAADPERYKQLGKERRARTHEARLEWQRQWRAKNSELYLAQSREMYWRDPEKYRKRSRDYSKNNPEKVLQINRRRKARLKNASVSKYTEQQVLALYGTDCHLCGMPIDMQAPRWTASPGWELGLHIDHVLPIARGGADCLENVRPSHGFCNVSKNANPFRGVKEKSESKLPESPQSSNQ